MSDEAVQQESHCLVILLYQLCRHSDHHPSQQEVMWHLSLLQRAPEWPLMSDVYPHQHLINSAPSSWLHPISSEPKYLSVSSFQDEPSSATFRTKVRGQREEGALILNTHKAELFLWWRPTIFGVRRPPAGSWRPRRPALEAHDSRHSASVTKHILLTAVFPLRSILIGCEGTGEVLLLRVVLRWRCIKKFFAEIETICSSFPLALFFIY